MIREWEIAVIGLKALITDKQAVARPRELADVAALRSLLAYRIRSTKTDPRRRGS